MQLLRQACLTVLILCQAPLARAQPADVPPILEQGRRLLSALTPENTGYRHRGWVRWPDAATGTDAQAFTDCSGLINGLLERTGHPLIERLRQAAQRQNPLARDYYRQIIAENGFARILTLHEVRVGDILAVSYPPGPGTTGHTMLVDAPPARRASATPPLIDGTVQWEIGVIDAAASPHGVLDNRFGEDGKKRNGVGRGVLRLYADEEGRPLGYSWSTLAGSRYQDAETNAVAIGRPLPLSASDRSKGP